MLSEVDEVFKTTLKNAYLKVMNIKKMDDQQDVLYGI